VSARLDCAVAFATCSAFKIISHRRPPPAVEPLRDLQGVEPDKPAHLEVWHQSLGDQAAHVAHSYAESLSELLDADEFWDLIGVGRVSPFARSSPLGRSCNHLLPSMEKPTSDTGYL